MFEKFTNGSRRVMVFCQDEARQLGHNVIAPHHIALGLLRHEKDRGSGPLMAMGVDAEALREEIMAESATAVPAGRRGASPPFTPECKRVLELSLREALKLGDNFISPGHQLLALLETGTPAALAGHVRIESARDAVRAHHDQDPSTKETEPSAPGRLRGFIEVMKSAVSQSTPGAPPGSQQILLALVSRQDTLAGRVLAELGVTEEKVHELIASIGPEGTLDEPPKPEDAIDVGGHVLRIADPGSRRAIEQALQDPVVADRIRVALLNADGPEEADRQSS